MPKSKIVREWIELDEAYLEDGPPKRPDYEASLIVNRCRLLVTPKGRVRLARHLDVECLHAPSDDARAEKVAEFASRPGVRRLAAGVDAGNVNLLPREDEHPAQDVMEGTAAIYQIASQAAAISEETRQ